jgi:hypothetical protein
MSLRAYSQASVSDNCDVNGKAAELKINKQIHSIKNLKLGSQIISKKEVGLTLEKYHNGISKASYH